MVLPTILFSGWSYYCPEHEKKFRHKRNVFFFFFGTTLQGDSCEKCSSEDIWSVTNLGLPSAPSPFTAHPELVPSCSSSGSHALQLHAGWVTKLRQGLTKRMAVINFRETNCVYLSKDNITPLWVPFSFTGVKNSRCDLVTNENLFFSFNASLPAKYFNYIFFLSSKNFTQ